MDFNQKSYKRHKSRSYEERKAEVWKRNDTVDYWRHAQMYQSLDPILISYPESSWLTVGDGRYGTDAHYISTFNNKVLATDISEEQLRKAHNEGFIREYQVENAESLSFDNSEFDFVLCKESYHHFPRPMVALYEMLRVARIGVVLIEPNDDKIATPQKSRVNTAALWFWMALKNWIKRAIGRELYYDQGRYEASGNHVYTISTRELEKVALGMNFPLVAIKGLNDHYIDGAEFEILSEDGPILNEIKRTIDKKNAASMKGFQPWGLLVAVIFKENPSIQSSKALRDAGFWLNKLLRNPHVSN